MFENRSEMDPYKCLVPASKHRRGAEESMSKSLLIEQAVIRHGHTQNRFCSIIVHVNKPHWINSFQRNSELGCDFLFVFFCICLYTEKYIEIILALKKCTNCP